MSGGSSEMVEHVARALYDRHVAEFGDLWPVDSPARLPWDRQAEVVRGEYRGQARAAIEAMRGDSVPVFEDISNMDKEWKESALARESGNILNAGESAAWCNGGQRLGYNGVLNIWRAMIDAALKDSP